MDSSAAQKSLDRVERGTVPGSRTLRLVDGVRAKPRAKVLLVDDDLQDLKYYEVILRAGKFDVVACGSYREAEGWLTSGVFDFVILSQGGPDFEGRQVLEWAIAVDRNLPVLVLTSRHEIRCYLDAVQLGAVDYVEKPVNPSDLMWILETHLKPAGQAAPGLAR